MIFLHFENILLETFTDNFQSLWTSSMTLPQMIFLILYFFSLKKDSFDEAH